MMQEIGVQNLEELFASIPSHLHFRGEFSFPKSLSEQGLSRHLKELADRNENVQDQISFLGGGAYHHYTPALIDALLSRGEFMTSYTPYQPEISQGTLQAIFEFQTLICQITGLDVANASMYDGASSAAEAVLMARRLQGDRKRILVSSTVHPSYRQVIRTYTSNLPVELIEIPYDREGRADADKTQELLNEDTICIVVQSPNYFGVVEDQAGLFLRARNDGAVCISVVAEALSLGILKSPGECGADIAAGEAQSLGLAPSYGGPSVGFLAARQKFVRSLPGRLVGMARDHQDRRGFVLTLAAREQHIRREKATSNICTNQGLCALAVTIYLSYLGGEGFRNLAIRNLQTADYARKRLGEKQILRFGGSHFNEFVLELRQNAEDTVQKLASKGIFAGIPLGKYYPELSNCLLVCCTEMTTRNHVDRLARELEELG